MYQQKGLPNSLKLMFSMFVKKFSFIITMTKQCIMCTQKCPCSCGISDAGALKVLDFKVLHFMRNPSFLAILQSFLLGFLQLYGVNTGGVVDGADCVSFSGKKSINYGLGSGLIGYHGRAQYERGVRLLKIKKSSIFLMSSFICRESGFASVPFFIKPCS